jgi:uncharacterized membrane protein
LDIISSQLEFFTSSECPQSLHLVFLLVFVTRRMSRLASESLMAVVAARDAGAVLLGIITTKVLLNISLLCWRCPFYNSVLTTLLRDRAKGANPNLNRLPIGLSEGL